MIWLVNFPLPPSVNDYLMPVAGALARNKAGKLYSKGRWVKTKEHADYLNRCHHWRAIHNISFSRIQDKLLRLEHEYRNRGAKFALRVDTFFAFDHSRLWTHRNVPQQLDADNRLKPCRDALASLLGIDDKYFFSGFFEKVSTTKESECTYLRISQMTPRTLPELQSQMRTENGQAIS